MFEKRTAIAPVSHEAPSQKVHTADIFERLNEADEVSILKHNWVHIPTEWVCRLGFGSNATGKLEFRADGPTMGAAVQAAFAKVDAARRRLR